MENTDKEWLIKMAELADNMINDFVEMNGVKRTISYLLDSNLTKEDLERLLFNEKDIDSVIKMKEETK